MKKIIFNFVLGIILCSSIVYGINLYKASDILYTTSDGVETNVNDSLNDLYDQLNNDAKITQKKVGSFRLRSDSTVTQTFNIGSVVGTDNKTNCIPYIKLTYSSIVGEYTQLTANVNGSYNSNTGIYTVSITGIDGHIVLFGGDVYVAYIE